MGDLRNHGLHPGRQVIENPRIGILINGQAAAGVESTQMQDALSQARGANPAVQLRVDAQEPLAAAVELELLERLLQAHH
jgi:hypothetical protein